MKMAAATILILSLAHVFINQVNRGRIYSHMRGGWSEIFDSMDEGKYALHNRFDRIAKVNIFLIINPKRYVYTVVQDPQPVT